MEEALWRALAPDTCGYTWQSLSAVRHNCDGPPDHEGLCECFCSATIDRNS